MFKKLISSILVVAMISSSALAGLDDAFNSLIAGSSVAVNDPGIYSSGSKTAVSGGGIGIRVPRPSSSPSLFSVTPPSWQAGCNGISAHFGGFSYISGAEFEQMLKTIASGAAAGFVSHLALKTLCPTCEAIVQFMKSQAQNAARLSVDSCRWGADLAKKYGPTISIGDPNESNAQFVCSTELSGTGQSSDFLKAIESQCGTVKESIDKLFGSLNIPNNPTGADAVKSDALKCSTKAGGNLTWAVLNSLVGRGGPSEGVGSYSDDDFLTKQVIMNLMGVEMGAATPEGKGCKDSNGSFIKSANPDATSSFCAPKLDANNLMNLFMCGAPSGNTFPGVDVSSTIGKSAFNTCSIYFASPDTRKTISAGKVWACASSDKENCDTVSLVDPSEIFKGTGFLISMANIMNKGVTAIRENKQLPSEVLNLMQSAPVPIYQILNIAAIYPSVADDLVSSTSTIMAEQLAMSYFDNLVKVIGRNSDSMCLNNGTANQILGMLSTARSAAVQRKDLIAQNLAAQELLLAQIKSVNIAIQKEVMTQDLISNSQMSQAINQSIISGTNVGSVESSAP